jgi:hypothetical protein
MGIIIPEQAVQELLDTQHITDLLAQRLAVASIITTVFTANHYPPPILVGGAAVSLYTTGMYGTVDTDFISGISDVDEIMRGLGYTQLGKDFYHPIIDSYVEFPAGALAGNYDMVVKYAVPGKEQAVHVIGIEDLILDRIDSYVATGHTESAEWAMRMMGGMYKSINGSYLHKEANRRGTLEQTERLQREVKRYKQKYQQLQAPVDHEQ